MKLPTLKANTTYSNRKQDVVGFGTPCPPNLLTLGHTLSATKGHVMCLSVAPSSSKANLEKTEAIAAQNPAATARENPTPLAMNVGQWWRMRTII